MITTVIFVEVNIKCCSYVFNSSSSPDQYNSSPQMAEAMIDRFISAQDVKDSSRAVYRRTLRQYLIWVERKAYSLSQITRVEILRYKEELLSSGMSSLTVGSYITSVRRFFLRMDRRRKKST